jgi:hypothetical protein
MLLSLLKPSISYRKIAHLKYSCIGKGECGCNFPSLKPKFKISDVVRFHHLQSLHQELIWSDSGLLSESSLQTLDGEGLPVEFSVQLGLLNSNSRALSCRSSLFGSAERPQLHSLVLVFLANDDFDSFHHCAPSDKTTAMML